MVKCRIGSRLARKAEGQPQCLADVRINSDCWKIAEVFGIGTVDPGRACRRMVKCELAHNRLRFSVAQSESAEGFKL